MKKPISKCFKQCLITLIVGGMSIVSTTTVRAAGPEHIQMLANMCSVCHGTGGKGADRIPKLNGELKAEKFIETMHGFVSGSEKATVMDTIAKALTDEELAALAKYFAALAQ